MFQFGRPYVAMRQAGAIAIAVTSLLTLTQCSRSSADYADATPGDWRSYGRDGAELRFSPLTEIDADNVARLGLAWSLELPEEHALASTPLAIDGVLYFTGGLGVVYAVDGVSGQLLWRYDPQTNKGSPREARRMFANNRGLAWWDGMVFVALKDGRMVALDARTGKLVWDKRFLIDGDRATSTGAPRAFNGKVIIGNSGAELGARGYVTTLDAKTGKILWRFFTVPGNPAIDTDETTRMAAKTWSGEWWKYGGGGTPWNGITYDAQFNQILIGAGNGGPWAGEYRRKAHDDNLFLASVVAVDADTGKYKWHYQYNPGEVWDWKATNEIMLADLKIDGKGRQVMMQAPSNGFFYVIDRSNGHLISAEKIGKATWADHIDLKTGRPVEKPGIRRENGPVVIYPSFWGAHNWQAASFNPATGLVYIPYMQMGMKSSPDPDSKREVTENPGRTQLRLGVIGEPYIDPKDPDDGHGALLAWDPVAQKVRWRVRYPSLWNAGTATTAGNLVFQGTPEGRFFAYDARNGKSLWSFDAKLGIVAPPIVFSTKGHQYVSLLVGYGTSAGAGGPTMAHGWKYGLQPRRMLTFRLDGKAALPETPPPDFTLNPLDDPKMVIDPAIASAGGGTYVRSVCIGCHGGGAASTGSAPDLREAAIAFDRAAFGKFLSEGPMVANGMPKFDDLTQNEVDEIYYYIRSEARAARRAASSGRAVEQHRAGF